MTAIAASVKPAAEDLSTVVVYEPANATQVLATSIIVAAVASLPLAMAYVALPSINMPILSGLSLS